MGVNQSKDTPIHSDFLPILALFLRLEINQYLTRQFINTGSSPWLRYTRIDTDALISVIYVHSVISLMWEMHISVISAFLILIFNFILVT